MYSVAKTSRMRQDNLTVIGIRKTKRIGAGHLRRRPVNNVAASTACILALVLAGYGLIATYDYWLSKRVTNQVRAIHTVYDSLPPQTPRYKVFRQRNNVLVTEVKPQQIPEVQTGPVRLHDHIDTTEPVIFITVDDGVHKEAFVNQFIMRLRLPLTLFLTKDAIHGNYHYFEKLRLSGSGIENHTATHPHMPKLPYEYQKQEICTTSDDLTTHYGTRPTLFRPPYGEYNDDTLRAAKDCGIEAIVLWNVVVDHGQLAYQASHTQLEPGDIVLLHFRPELMQDLRTVLNAAHQRGLSIASLNDWLP